MNKCILLAMCYTIMGVVMDTSVMAKRLETDTINVCLGTNIRGTETERWKNLNNACSPDYRRRYENCTHVLGNLEIFGVVSAPEGSDWDEFVFFRHIREVTGYVFLSNIKWKNVVFPSLRIIRGESRFRIYEGDPAYALLVAHSEIESLEFPKLTEISRGNVGIMYMKQICNLMRVKWREILMEENTRFLFIPQKSYDWQGQKEQLILMSFYQDGYSNYSGVTCAECHSNCNGGCWGEGLSKCQNFSKLYCNSECGGGRCFGEGANECCHSFCVGGCTGPESSDCASCKYAYEDGKCRRNCSEGMFAVAASSCVKECPTGTFLDEDEKTCLAFCPDDKHHLNGICNRVLPPAKKCRAPSDYLTKIYFGNVEYFRNCTILDGDIQISSFSFQKRYSDRRGYTGSMEPRDLEVFSTLQEVYGHVFVDHVENHGLANFTYFRNIQVIQRRVSPCSHRDSRLFTFVIMETPISTLNFRNLRKISGRAGIFYNKNLCYVNSVNWSAIVDQQVYVEYNKADEECRNEGRVCSEQCKGNSCWGPSTEECACLEYRQEGKCVNSCETDRGFFIDGQNCVRECPEGKYISGNECIECHGRCDGECSDLVATTGKYAYCTKFDQAAPKVAIQTTVIMSLIAVTFICLAVVATIVIRYRIREIAYEAGAREQNDGTEVPEPLDDLTLFRDSPELQSLPATSLVDASSHSEENLADAAPQSANESVQASPPNCSSSPLVLHENNSVQRSPYQTSPYIVSNLVSSPQIPSEFAGPNLRSLRMLNEGELQRFELLGYGSFGDVYRGMWVPQEGVKIHVAIKILNGACAPEKTKKLVDEAYLMARIRHPHLLSLVGLCISSAQIMLVMQMLPLGNLESFIKNYKDIVGSKTILTWCTQIARGMRYLEDHRLVHRDLAARNVLMETPSCVKITDFGLSKLLDWSEKNFKAGKERLPFQWMAIECLKFYTFSHKSDVWAFGVTVWEILTYGKTPFEEVPYKEIESLLTRGYRLKQPSICTLDLYHELVKTWLPHPDARPSFEDLIETFAKMCANPGTYICILGDEKMQFPKYTREDEHDLIRSMASRYDDRLAKIKGFNERYQEIGSTAGCSNIREVAGHTDINTNSSSQSTPWNRSLSTDAPNESVNESIELQPISDSSNLKLPSE